MFVHLHTSEWEEEQTSFISPLEEVIWGSLPGLIRLHFRVALPSCVPFCPQEAVGREKVFQKKCSSWVVSPASTKNLAHCEDGLQDQDVWVREVVAGCRDGCFGGIGQHRVKRETRPQLVLKIYYMFPDIFLVTQIPKDLIFFQSNWKAEEGGL